MNRKLDWSFMMHRFLNPIQYAGLAILLTTTACTAAEDLPNIVIIYADDKY